MKFCFVTIALIKLCVIHHINCAQYKSNRLEHRSLQFKAIPSNKDYCTKNHETCIKHNVYYERIKTMNRRSGTSDFPVCAFNKETGFANFPNPCEIALQNCKIRLPYVMRNAFAEIKNVKGIFYYNGQVKPCSYYFTNTKSNDEAVRLYYSDTLNIDKIPNEK